MKYNKGRHLLRLQINTDQLKALNDLSNMDFSSLCRSQDNVADIVSVMSEIKKYTDSYLYKLAQEDEQ